MVRAVHPDKKSSSGGGKKGRVAASSGTRKSKPAKRHRRAELLLTLEPLRRRFHEIAADVMSDYETSVKMLEAMRGGRRKLNKAKMVVPSSYARKLTLRTGSIRLIARLVQRHIMSQLVDGYSFALARAGVATPDAATAKKSGGSSGPTLTPKDMQMAHMFSTKAPLY